MGSIRKHRLLPGLAMTIAIIFAIQACAPQLIHIDKQQLATLKDQPEIQGIHHALPPKPDCSWVRGKGVDTIAVMTGGLGAIFLLGAAKSCLDAEREQYLDVSPRVKDRFLGVAKPTLNLQNVRLIDEPVPKDDLESLRLQYGPAMVLDFKVTRWELVTPGYARYRLPTALRARLLRLSDSKILWQGVCELGSAEATGTTGAGQAASAETPALMDLVEQSGKRCVDDLLAQFLGQGIAGK